MKIKGILCVFSFVMFSLLVMLNAGEVGEDNDLPAKGAFFLPFANEVNYTRNHEDLDGWSQKMGDTVIVMTWTFVVSSKEFQKYHLWQEKRNRWVAEASKETDKPLRTIIKSIMLENGSYRISVGIALGTDPL